MKIIDENGEKLENQEAAAFLNEYYVNVGPSLAEKQNLTWDCSKCKINTESNFSLRWITEREVRNHVKDICITKSSAIDEISTRLLKDAFECITFELTYLYNTCIMQGSFPRVWGESKVTPIPKTTHNSSKPGDWRPISQISLPGKILEKIVHLQLVHYLEINNLLSKNQYGFRRGYSTSFAIFDVLKTLHENWNDNLFSACVFVDFSRAFDSIDHKILLQKLKLYGLDDTALQFMSNYISCRRQKTTVNGYDSPFENITFGTAQGSILGPLIFILYVKDLFLSLSEEATIYMYADDTLLLNKSNDINEVTVKAQNALTKMSKWCEANKLTINLGKTKYMVVKHVKNSQPVEIKLNANVVSTVHQYEYLGMVLDDRLTMNEYLDVVWKKTNAKIGILSKIRRFISEKTATRIYKCMIRPHLDYIDFVIESGSVVRVKKLDNLQRKAIRRIEYCTNVENKQNLDVLIGKYKIEDLGERRKRNLAKIMYSLSAESENVENNVRIRELRSSKKVKMKNRFTNKTRVFTSPFYRGLRLWDSLPAEIQKEKDKRVFLKKLSASTLKGKVA